MKRVAIIGAGAAGCFCAVQLRRMAPEVAVTLFEAGPKPMAKLSITGGGRCNLTNSFAGIRSLGEAYPRGERVLQRVLKAFSPEDTVRWFEVEGVPLVLQPDHCWFPRSQNALDIVHCLERGMRGATLRLRTPVLSVRDTLGPSGLGMTNPVIPNTPSVIPSEASVSHYTVNNESFDYVVVTTGGAAKGLPFLEGLGLELIQPVPSLFTFTVPDPALRSLMGLVTEASVGLAGTSYKAEGPLLITDWGLSGPAVLKLSSYAARHLAEQQYKGTVVINWLNARENEVREQLQGMAVANPQKLVASVHPVQQRLWEHLLDRLTAALTADSYPLSGKSKFRDEFVTAGGVALSNINLSTLESKRHPGLFFAGEVLDIDAITGGFNLQAAWSTGYVCAQNIAKSL